MYINLLRSQTTIQGLSVNEHTFHCPLLVPFMHLFVNTTEQEVLSFHMQSVLPRVNQLS